ncbi:MAG: response regulator transcription factor, partial [Rhodothermales bacterium]|nr:response regulator transcription factor [Rhodothermales bacterium]
MKQTVFVVDDHPMMRRGYVSLIDGEPDLRACGEAGSAREALQRIPDADPDLVIADISLEGTNGIEMVKRLQAHRPALRVLVISMHDERLYAERALHAGARGYLMKTADDEEVLHAIR